MPTLEEIEYAESWQPVEECYCGALNHNDECDGRDECDCTFYFPCECDEIINGPFESQLALVLAYVNNDIAFHLEEQESAKNTSLIWLEVNRTYDLEHEADLELENTILKRGEFPLRKLGGSLQALTMSSVEYLLTEQLTR